MASTIFFNGRVIATPGVYSEIDASGLEQVGLGASGIVAIVGTGEGGVPASAYTDGAQLVGFTTPARVRRTFRSGDLREACTMVFEPSSDPLITAGAQVVVPVKVNPSTRSTTVLAAASGRPSILLTSLDYGAYTAQINALIQPGLVSGRLVTINFESTTEATNNVGGLSMFSLTYTPPLVGGWEQMNLQVLSDRIRAYGVRDDAGLSADITDSTPDTLPVQVAASAANAGVLVTVYGNTALANAVSETVAISGVAAVQFTTQFTDIFGARLSAPVAAASTVEITDSTSPTPDTLISFAAGDQYQGVVPHTGFYVANSTLLLNASGASTDEVHLWGRGPTGVVQSERVVLAGTAGVRTSSSWSQIDYVVLGDIGAVTVNIQGVAVETVQSVQSTLRRVVDYFNARQIAGATPRAFVAAITNGLGEMSPDRLDLTVATGGTNVYNTVAPFYADADAIVQQVNVGSSLVSAERIAFAPQLRTLTFVATATTTYTATIDGTACSYTSLSPTSNAAVQAGIIAAVNNNPTVSRYVVASAGSTATTVVLTGITANAFTLSTSGTLTIGLTQELTGVGQVPANLASAQYLTGGSEGAATFSDWQHALNLLRQRRVNTVVVLTGDPAVHAELAAHCAYMCGIGRSERDGIVGLSALDANDDPLNTLPSSTSILTQIQNLNTRHIRAFAQSIERYDTFGERRTFLPWYLGVLAAGMQAGSPVGTSLTHKFVNVLGHSQNSSWNVVDNGEELIQGGLCFIEQVPGVGRRIVRNVTTHLTSNNTAYTEASVNEAVNYAVYELRAALEPIVGRRGNLTNVLAAKAAAAAKLAQLVNEGVITNWRALSLELVVDVLQVSVEIAPVIPINFIQTTVYLNTLPISAT